MRGMTTFAEVMAGAVRLAAPVPVAGQKSHPVLEPASSPVTAPLALRLDLRIAVPGLLLPWGDATGAATGRVLVPGLADGPVSGTMRIAPLAARQIRYRLSFHTLDGVPLRLDGWKSITARHPVRSMTVLPVTLYGPDHGVLGAGTLRFDLRADLPAFLAGFRYRRIRQHSGEGVDLG